MSTVMTSASRYRFSLSSDDIQRPLHMKGKSIGMDDLYAWCIVPYDRRKRTPEERIAMLQQLGFTRYAYDWRPEHLPETARELTLAREQHLHIQGVWMWIDPEQDRPGNLSALNQRMLTALWEARAQTQIWVSFHEQYFQGLNSAEAVAKSVDMIRHVTRRAADAGCRVALYNHGGWFGEPENQTRLIDALPDCGLGVVYNFHHAHHQIDRFDALVEVMRPHLWAVTLNGMRPAGPKILPIGSGTHEQSMLQRILDAGFRGPFGILGHVENADVKLILRRNLEGLGVLPR